MCPPSSPPAVLLVDDDPNVLAALRRTLRGDSFEIVTASSGAEALVCLDRREVDVVVSDLNMPGMDGTALLARVRERWPHTARIVLTGTAELDTTIASINRGEIYRYVLKPWHGGELRGVIDQALDRCRLYRERDALHRQTREQAEALLAVNATLEERVVHRTRELTEARAALEKANVRLRGSFFTSMQVFGALLDLRGGKIAGHSRRVAELARRLSAALGLEEGEAQHVFVAALLHDVGKIGFPDTLLKTPVEGMNLDQVKLYRLHAERGEQALMAVEELRPALRIIRAHHERFDGRGFPDGLRGRDIPVGARILAIANDYDGFLSGALLFRAFSANEALQMIQRGRGTQYDPEIVDRFVSIARMSPTVTVGGTPCSVGQVKPGDTVMRDLVTRDGLLLLSNGHVLTDRLIELLRSYEVREGAKLVIYVAREPVLCPAE